MAELGPRDRSASAEPPPRFANRLLLITLLGGAFIVPLVLSTGKSVSYDEVAHLPAGYSYLRTGAIHLNPMHPPLIKEICALPLLFLGVPMPQTAETLGRPDLPLWAQWAFGRAFLGKDVDRLIFWGRVPAVLLSLGLASVVAAWAHELWGTPGSLLALFLYVFDPTITAHAQLVTTDVGFASFATLYLYLLRKVFQRRSWQRLSACGIALGLALGSKFSGVALIPVTLLLLAVEAQQHDDSVAERIVRGAKTLLILGVLASFVVWAVYFFPCDPLFYVRGLRAVNEDHDPTHQSLLLGRLSADGWHSYLLMAWLIKTPLPSLLLFASSVLLYLRGRRAAGLEEAFLIVPLVTLFVGYSLTTNNLGVRYLIPVFPFVFVFTARIGTMLDVPTAATVVAAAVLWMVIEFVSISPDHLSYFNEIAGGADHGPEWLDDSNVDWGQGLIQLRSYLEHHPSPGFRFCYFGSFDPSVYGVHGQMIELEDIVTPPAPGTWILSSHCVARARAAMALVHGNGPENWLAHTAPQTVVGHAYYVYEISS